MSSRISRKPLSLGVPYELYEQVRAVAIAELNAHEPLTGAIQRWIIAAVREQLARGPIPEQAYVVPSTEGTVPGSLAEARAKIAYYKAQAEKPGQYAPVAARMQGMQRQWEQELQLRQQQPPAQRQLQTTTPPTAPTPSAEEFTARTERSMEAAVARGEYPWILKREMEKLNAAVATKGLQYGSEEWMAYLNTCIERALKVPPRVWERWRAPQLMLAKWQTEQSTDVDRGAQEPSSEPDERPPAADAQDDYNPDDPENII